MKRLSSINKKAQVNSIAPAIIALVFAAVVLVLGLVILEKMRDTDAVASSGPHNQSSYTAANDTLVGLATFADFWEIIVLAIVTTVVIGLLLVVFGGRSAR